MLLPDINLLVYAHNVRSPRHPQALEWWNGCLQGPQAVGLAWVVMLGFVRITTHPKVFERPMSVDESVGRVAEWLELPHVQVVHPAQRHFEGWAKLLRGIGSAGNLTTDAHLAALAIERKLMLCSTDADFARFPGLRWSNPLA
ncbi:MAG: type II toxin-antitoxin system VapC family toxin [Akkermansiaceae bacterium]